MIGSQPDQRAPAPNETLRIRDAVAITVGIVLGAGIFRAPSLVAQGSASGEVMLLLWIGGGLIALVGALCYAELAAAYPDAGGDYHFLRRAFGGRFAFVYGWARLAVIQSGSIAVLAFVFGDYATRLLPLGDGSAAIHAAIAVVAITALNWAGVRQGAVAQNVLTVIEVGGLVTVIVAGLFLAPAAPPATAAPEPVMSIGLAMVFVLLTFGGWNEAAYVSAELRGGGRRVLPVLLISLAVLSVLYVLANLAYLRTLGLAGLTRSDAVAADVMQVAFGPAGAAPLAVAVAVAALTSANATIITGARSAYALGRDVPAFARLGRWDVASGSPRNALIVQGAIALALVATGAFARSGFQLAVEYTAPVFWFYFLMAGVSLFVLRRREPGHSRPYRVPLYPVLPLAFCAANAWLLWSSLAYTGIGALVGVVVVVTGCLLLLFVKPRSSLKENDR